MRKKVAILFTASSLLFSIPLSAFPAEAATYAATSYRFTYKLPADVTNFVTMTVDSSTITNPQPKELVEKYRYSIGDFYTDSLGGYVDQKQWYGSVVMETQKVGFLLNLYNMIAVLPPVYPSGYNSEEMHKKIDQQQMWTEEKYKLHTERAKVELQARIQALQNAGYVKPEEITQEQLTKTASKEFVANVLYRVFKGIRPYKGSVFPLDSSDVAVRWAIEAGLPGFDVDPKGNVYPRLGLQVKASPNFELGNYPYVLLFNYLHALFPVKKAGETWQYYQSKGTFASLNYEYFVYVNGQPVSQATARNPQLLNNKSFKQGFDQTITRVKAELNAKILQALQVKRQDVMKPRIWDWRKDVLINPLFKQVIANYRKTKSSQSLDAVYFAVKKQYNLYPRQDSLAILKSVLDHVR